MNPGPLHAARALALACAAGAGVAYAEPPQHARLDYTLGPGAEHCPDRARLALLVAAHLGYDPFDRAGGNQRLVVSVELQRGELVAALELFGDDGASAGSQRLSSPDLQCRELADSLALALSLAIDPLSLSRPKPSPAPPAVEREVVAPPAPVVAPSPFFALSLGVDGAVGMLPAPTIGVSLGGELRWRRLSLALAMGIDAPSGQGGQSDGSASYQAWLSWLSLGPCLRAWVFGGCAVVVGGVVSASGTGYSVPQTPLTPYLAVGAQGFVELPLTDWLALRPQVELDAPIFRTALTVASLGTLWSTSPIVGSLGARAVLVWK